MYARGRAPLPSVCVCIRVRVSVYGVGTTKLSWLKPRTGAGRGCGRGDAESTRGLSQPLSQCKHVLIEIRSSGYNSFADVAARPSLSFSLPTPTRHPLAASRRYRPIPAIPCTSLRTTPALASSLSIFLYLSLSHVVVLALFLRAPTPTSHDPRHLGVDGVPRRLRGFM